MKELLDKYISGKKVVILGFGREGRSSYRLIRRYFPNQEITIADKNPGLDISDIDNSDFTTFCLGAHYLDCLSHVDIIFKSPGVFLKHPENAALASKIVTQTSLFLQKYSRQIIGVTGTKGKSTTSSLIHHIFQIAGRKSVFVGNIGVPAFDAIPEIDNGSAIIFELSAHQLEQVKHSPHISILLNVFNEHLDYFKSFGVYSEAKLNWICNCLKEGSNYLKVRSLIFLQMALMEMMFIFGGIRYSTAYFRAAQLILAAGN
ncbi:MAG: hypothetical protein B6I19_04220 [Bacteroidetes bacterium 4572_114]|nr:MAG: hypothetical protein B6I19_04220 [Bacteroidetes bacterium 4572_114]